MITNFLPSARTSLRLDPDDVWAVNPRLVYAKGHGQGQRGPDADQGGFDSVSYWACGGLGHVLTPTDGPLVMQRAAMGDGPSGAFLAGGVAAALYQREKTGTGVGRRRRAARHRGVDARARPRRDHDPAHRSRAARRRAWCCRAR